MNQVVNINDTKLPIEELHLLFLIYKLRNDFGFLESSRNNIPVNGNGEIIPLYTYPCYEYLNSIDWTDDKIFEFGCGWSTFWWKSLGADVYGVDNDQTWIDKINSHSNLNIKMETDEKKYSKSIYEHDMKFDVIVLDSIVRYNCACSAMDKLKSGGMIILDNSDWYTNTKELLDENSDLIPIHFHGFKVQHVESETTSCYIHRDFDKKARSILPIGGTERKPNIGDSKGRY